MVELKVSYNFSPLHWSYCPKFQFYLLAFYVQYMRKDDELLLMCTKMIIERDTVN